MSDQQAKFDPKPWISKVGSVFSLVRRPDLPNALNQYALFTDDEGDPVIACRFCTEGYSYSLCGGPAPFSTYFEFVITHRCAPERLMDAVCTAADEAREQRQKDMEKMEADDAAHMKIPLGTP